MPRNMPRRQPTAVRLSATVLEEIDRLALQEGLVKGDGEPNRSEWIRLAVEFSKDRMEPGWRPDYETDAIGTYRKYESITRKPLPPSRQQQGRGHRPAARVS